MPTKVIGRICAFIAKDQAPVNVDRLKFNCGPEMVRAAVMVVVVIVAIVEVPENNPIAVFYSLMMETDALTCSTGTCSCSRRC